MNWILNTLVEPIANAWLNASVVGTVLPPFMSHPMWLDRRDRIWGRFFFDDEPCMRHEVREFEQRVKDTHDDRIMEGMTCVVSATLGGWRRVRRILMHDREMTNVELYAHFKTDNLRFDFTRHICRMDLRGNTAYVHVFNMGLTDFEAFFDTAIEPLIDDYIITVSDDSDGYRDLADSIVKARLERTKAGTSRKGKSD